MAKQDTQENTSEPKAAIISTANKTKEQIKSEAKAALKRLGILKSGSGS